MPSLTRAARSVAPVVLEHHVRRRGTGMDGGTNNAAAWSGHGQGESQDAHIVLCVPTEYASDAQKHGAARDAVTGDGRRWRMFRAQALRYLCVQRLRRRPATPSCDAVP